MNWEFLKRLASLDKKIIDKPQGKSGQASGKQSGGVSQGDCSDGCCGVEWKPQRAFDSATKSS